MNYLDIPAKYWDLPWNPVTGCTKISPACLNCWAETLAMRFNGGNFSVELHPDLLNNPPGGKDKTIFVCNTSDLFHRDVSQSFALACFNSMNRQNRHLILTKRPNRMNYVMKFITDYGFDDFRDIWLGTSIWDQKSADENIPHLLRTPASNRWLSVEPLLGEITIDKEKKNYFPFGYRDEIDGPAIDKGISWVVVGCESGANARPCKIEWIEWIVGQCDVNNVPVFVKQIQIDGKCVTDIKKFPKHLQIRELPWSA